MTTFRERLEANYKSAFNQKISEEIVGLSQESFLTGLRSGKEWSLGPFRQAPELTFTKASQLGDPTGIGWTSSSTFNPTIIEESGELFLFYRAAVKKESLGSRIGLARYRPETGWREFTERPMIFPTEENEILSVEDPKVYRFGHKKFVMFYNGVWRASAEEIAEYEKPFGDVACDIKYAFSDDLINWEKRGLVVPYEVSRLWAKGAVIPRDQHGNAVKINGEYLMFLSEGCGDRQFIGRSRDMCDWEFEERTYLELPREMGRKIFEVATAVVTDNCLVIDFMYEGHDGRHLGAEALYDLSDPRSALDFVSGATLAWGGLIKYQGKWCFAQGWDAEPGREQILFYLESEN
jgi:predicted GH43/DUF377 family glycosyl hydrolase